MHRLRAVDPDGVGVVYLHIEHHVTLPAPLHLHIAGKDGLACGLARFVERALCDVVLRAVEVEAQRVSLRGRDRFRVVLQAALADDDVVGRCGIDDGGTAEEEKGGKQENVGIEMHCWCYLFVCTDDWMVLCDSCGPTSEFYNING